MRGMTMSARQGLYETDFLLWTREQSARLRAFGEAGSSSALDREHLADEVEDMGRSQSRELASRVRRIIEHLLKRQHSPPAHPRADWSVTIGNHRAEIARLLEASPSPRRTVPSIIQAETETARHLATLGMMDYGESLPTNTPAYTTEQVLADWFPAPPTASR